MGTVGCGAITSTGDSSMEKLTVDSVVLNGTSITDGTATLSAGALYNVTTINCGAITSTGKLNIYENTGTTLSGTDGTIILEHGNINGTSSILFKSANNTGSDYGAIEYSSGNNGDEKAILRIISQNDGNGSVEDQVRIKIASTDKVVFASNGVSINKNTNPTESLDVNGNIKASGLIQGAPGTICKIHILRISNGSDILSTTSNSTTYHNIANASFVKTANTNLFGEVYINYYITGSGGDDYRGRLRFDNNASKTGDYIDIMDGGGRSGNIASCCVYTNGDGTTNSGTQYIYLDVQKYNSNDDIYFGAGYFKVTEIWSD